MKWRRRRVMQTRKIWTRWTMEKNVAEKVLRRRRLASKILTWKQHDKVIAGTPARKLSFKCQAKLIDNRLHHVKYKTFWKWLTQVKGRALILDDKTKDSLWMYRLVLPLLLPRASVPWLWSLLLDPTQWRLILASVALLGRILYSWWLPLLRRRCPRRRKQLPRRWRGSCWRWPHWWRRWFHQQGLLVFLEIRSTPGHSGQGK